MMRVTERATGRTMLLAMVLGGGGVLAVRAVGAMWGGADGALLLVVLTIAAWAWGRPAESVTALAFFTVGMLAGIAPPAVLFSGFQSSAVWLVFSGAVVGAAIRHAGLGDRIAGGLLRVIGGGHRRALAGVTLFGTGLAFVMPSAMGRAMLIVPILAAVADRLGYRHDGKGRSGILIGGVLGTYLPASAILPANVPNNVLAGLAETVLGLPLSYGGYLLLHFPVLGAVKTLLLIGLLLWLHDEEPATVSGSVPSEPWSGAQIALGAGLAAATLLWMTDGWHGVSPAWVGMALAVPCLFPASGMLGNKPFQAINLEPVFYVAAIVGLGALVHHHDLGGEAMARLAAVLPASADSPGRAFALLSGIAALAGLAVTLPGVPAVLTPFTASFAQSTGLSPMAVLMLQVVGFSTVFLPYQAPPLMVAMRAGGLPPRDLTRLCLITAALTIVLLWPLDAVWWRVLGWMS